MEVLETLCVALGFATLAGLNLYLVVLVTGNVVAEGPAAARAVHEVADILLLAAPEPAHAALLARLLPAVGVDMAVGIERRDELVAVPGRTVRMLLGARQIEADLLQTHGCLLCPVASGIEYRLATALMSVNGSAYVRGRMRGSEGTGP